MVLIALWGYVTWIDFLLDINPSKSAPLCFYWPSMPLPMLLQVKYWTRTCATTSVCSFRRAHWTTSSNRSYGTTSTYAPSPVSTPYGTTYVTLIHYTPTSTKQMRNVQYDLLLVHMLLSEAFYGNSEDILYASHSWKSNPLKAALMCCLSVKLQNTYSLHICKDTCSYCTHTLSSFHSPRSHTLQNIL